ncbi:MAG TPA: nicotinate (nicotinamide) nucleotide adenylyltransferase [Gemmatimonadaceae bacterium]|nr:nicotinate (nicotinamide) nucleotide adenylyltransferase [Gemmatimonadaceae bacterium]
MSASGDLRRIGVLGGTFDPPHVGHLLAAGDAAERLQLERILWVPAWQQPLKAAPTAAPSEHRLRMVELTIAGDPRHALEPMEVERGGLSYTVDTLQALGERHPAAELFLLLGEDAWRTFQSWREPARILELATVAVLMRDSEVQSSGAADAGGGPDSPPVTLPTRRIDVSATEIRNRLRAGLSIRGFVVESVERYIAEHELYH